MRKHTFKSGKGVGFGVVIGLLNCLPTQAAEVANVPDSLKARLSTSSAGLSEQFGVTGRLVRLQGRFQTLSVAETGADGQTTVKCLSPGPQAVKAVEAIGRKPPEPDDAPTPDR